MDLAAELTRAVEAALGFAEEGEEVVGIVPSEPREGVRVYVCAFARGEERSWLALGAEGRPVAERLLVREAVSIAAMCEAAEEAAGVEEDEPRVASSAYLDSLGAVAEGPVLGEALKQAVGPADELTRDVEANHKTPLR